MRAGGRAPARRGPGGTRGEGRRCAGARAASWSRPPRPGRAPHAGAETAVSQAPSERTRNEPADPRPAGGGRRKAGRVRLGRRSWSSRRRVAQDALGCTYSEGAAGLGAWSRGAMQLRHAVSWLLCGEEGRAWAGEEAREAVGLCSHLGGGGGTREWTEAKPAGPAARGLGTAGSGGCPQALAGARRATPTGVLSLPAPNLCPPVQERVKYFLFGRSSFPKREG